MKTFIIIGKRRPQRRKRDAAKTAAAKVRGAYRVDQNDPRALEIQAVLEDDLANRRAADAIQAP